MAFDWPLSRSEKLRHLVGLFQRELQAADAESRRKEATLAVARRQIKANDAESRQKDKMLAAAQRQIQVDRMARKAAQADFLAVQEVEAENESYEVALRELTLERQNLLETLQSYEQRYLAQEDELDRLERELWSVRPTQDMTALVKNCQSEASTISSEEQATGYVHTETAVLLMCSMEWVHQDRMQASAAALRVALDENFQLQGHIKHLQFQLACLHEDKVKASARPRWRDDDGLGKFSDLSSISTMFEDWTPDTILRKARKGQTKFRTAASVEKPRRRKGVCYLYRRRQEGQEALGRRTRCWCHRLVRKAARQAMRGEAMKEGHDKVRAVCRRVQAEQTQHAAEMSVRFAAPQHVADQRPAHSRILGVGTEPVLLGMERLVPCSTKPSKQVVTSEKVQRYRRHRQGSRDTTQRV